MKDLLAAMCLWGTLGVFVMWSGLSAMEVAFYRCIISAVLLGAWLIHAKHPFPKCRAAGVTALAGVFLVLNWVFLFKSFQVSSITVGNMSYYLQPVILIVLGIIFYSERVSLIKWVVMAAALAGVLLTVDPRQAAASPGIAMGAFYALLAAFLYALVTLLMKSVHSHYSGVLFIQMIVGTFILLPFIHFHSPTIIAFVCIAIIVIVHTLLAYFLYYKSIQTVDFARIAVVSYLDPIVAIGTDILFFNRHLNVLQTFGVFLTFAALYMLVVNTGSRRSLVSNAS